MAANIITEVVKVRRASEASAAARHGAAVLKGGGLVGFATETVYGVAAMAGNAVAMERLRELKSRPDRPFTVHIGSPTDVARYVRRVPSDATWLIRKGWPGPITLVLPVGGHLADAKLQRAGLYDVLCSEDRIGLRCPDEPVACQMLAAVDGPVVAPSANLAGEPSPRTAEDVLTSLNGRIDLLIDSGPTKFGRDSTIVQFDSAEPRGQWRIVRPGVWDERTIRRLLRRKIVFVCTGNTCRSPMAAGIARKLLADRLGCEVSELRRHGVEILSAGLYATEGSRATPEAVLAAGELGADLSRHQGRVLTSDLISEADMVLCMTDFHVAQVRRLSPESSDKVCRLDSKGDVPDPVGGGSGVYRKIAERLGKILNALCDEGII